MSILKHLIDPSIAQNKINPFQQALEIQSKCAEVGFDWPDVAPVFEKVIEEVEEVKEALYNQKKDQQDIEEEMGDLLFACINLCRHLRVDAQQCLHQANTKFSARFMAMEELLAAKSQSLSETSEKEFDELWNIIKGK